MWGLSAAAKAFVPRGCTAAAPPQKKAQGSSPLNANAAAFSFNANAAEFEFPAPKELSADAPEFKPPPAFTKINPVSALNFADYSSDEDSDENTICERKSDAKSKPTTKEEKAPTTEVKDSMADPSSAKSADVEDNKPVDDNEPTQVTPKKAAKTPLKAPKDLSAKAAAPAAVLTPDAFPSLGGKPSAKPKAWGPKPKEQEADEEAVAWGPKAKKLEASGEKECAAAKASAPKDMESTTKSDAMSKAETLKEETAAVPKASEPKAEPLKEETAAVPKASEPKVKEKEPVSAKPKEELKSSSAPKAVKKEEPPAPKIDVESFPTLGGPPAVAKAWGPKAKQQVEAVAKEIEKKKEVEAAPKAWGPRSKDIPKDEEPKQEEPKAKVEPVQLKSKKADAAKATKPAATGEAITPDECVASKPKEDDEPSSPAVATPSPNAAAKGANVAVEAKSAIKAPEPKAAAKAPEPDEKPRPARWLLEETKTTETSESVDQEKFPSLGGEAFPTLGGNSPSSAGGKKKASTPKTNATPKAKPATPKTKKDAQPAELVEEVEKAEEIEKVEKASPKNADKSNEASKVEEIKKVDTVEEASTKSADKSKEASKPWRKTALATDSLPAAEPAIKTQESKPWRKDTEPEAKSEDKARPAPWRKASDMKDETEAEEDAKDKAEAAAREKELQEEEEAQKKVIELKKKAEAAREKAEAAKLKVAAAQKARDEATRLKATAAEPEVDDDDKPSELRMAASTSDVTTVAPSSQGSEKDDIASEETEEESIVPEADLKAKSKSKLQNASPSASPSARGGLAGMLTGNLTSLSPGARLGPSKVSTVRTGFTVTEMMRWRFAAQNEELRDEAVTWSVAMVEMKGSGTPTASSGVKADGEEGGWREDAARSQKARDQKPRGDRSGQTGDRRNEKIRSDEPQPVLETSENSWAVRQKQLKEEIARKGETEKSDAEVIRSMKSILNKLTIEKYDILYKQMLSCGMSKVEHVSYLVHEIMEKATTQHHFIEMYAQLCQHLHEWFVENAISKEDSKNGFKRILLNECQNSFEKYLRPLDFSGLDGEELREAQVKFKLTMLGNIKFVGTLLGKRMLASSVLIAVAEDLVSDPTTAEALESLAVFLTTVGGTFDRPDWQHHQRFAAVLDKVSKKTKDKATPARVRFLLQDVLDLRATGWEDKKTATKKQEGPSKLDEVKEKADAEESNKNRQSQGHPSQGNFSPVSRRAREEKRSWDDGW